MAKFVHETAAGKKISAFVILNKAGKLVALVNAHHAPSGAVTVDVRNVGDMAAVKCWDAAVKQGRLSKGEQARYLAAADTKRPWMEEDKRLGWAIHDRFQTQQGVSSNCDALVDALHGMWIDGVQLVGTSMPHDITENMLKAYVKDMSRPFVERSTQAYWDNKARKIGARFCNYLPDRGAFGSLYFCGGLDRLKEMGYQVIQAI